MLNGTKLDEITLADIQRFIDDDVSERKELEYKRDLPFADKDQKSEFLFDLCSLANASGGHLIIGMDTHREGDKKGLPKKIVGVDRESEDELKLKILNLVRDRIEPRLRLNLKTILLEDDKKMLVVIEVPQSFNSPHTVKDRSLFYSRNSAGRYHLDVSEIRQAFLLSETYEERISDWRVDRLVKILSGEIPFELAGPASLVLQVVPLSTMVKRTNIDLHTNKLLINHKFFPLTEDGAIYPPVFNFDGALSAPISSDGQTWGYCQLFKNGFVEALAVIGGQDQFGKETVSGYAIENKVLVSLQSYLKGLTELGINAPFFIAVSLLGVKGVHLVSLDRHSSFNKQPIDRSTLAFPGVMLEKLDADLYECMRSTFDTLWNAGGYSKSPFYDDEGKRRDDYRFID